MLRKSEPNPVPVAISPKVKQLQQRDKHQQVVWRQSTDGALESAVVFNSAFSILTQSQFTDRDKANQKALFLTKSVLEATYKVVWLKALGHF